MIKLHPVGARVGAGVGAEVGVGVGAGVSAGVKDHRLFRFHLSSLCLLTTEPSPPQLHLAVVLLWAPFSYKFLRISLLR